jgi:hypothetical protein
MTGTRLTRRAARLAGLAALGLQVVHASATLAATSPKKVVVTWKTVVGTRVAVDRWGFIQVALVVRKQSTTLRKKTTVKRRITAVRLPVYPNSGAVHTIGLNRQVIPVLAQEVLREQFATEVDVISEATDTSLAFERSLQAALVKGRRT